MSTFPVELLSPARISRIDGVESFVGRDQSGAFGIQAGHAPFATCLVYGLARFRPAGGPWTYAALPGGILHVEANRLRVWTRLFYLGEDLAAMTAHLEGDIAASEAELRSVRQEVEKLDEELMRRLLALVGAGGGGA